MARFDYDVVIVGSGFGGSVAALRAAEKGYRVGVLESGREILAHYEASGGGTTTTYRRANGICPSSCGSLRP